MILRQFLHNDPVGISYLFGCGGKAAGAVVDPVGDIQPYLQAADNAGMRTHFVIDTHVHADHISAGRALADAAGAAYVLSAEAGVSFPYKGVRDGEVLPLGNVSATVLHARSHARAHLHSCDGPDARRRTLVRLDRPHSDGRRSRPDRTRR